VWAELSEKLSDVVDPSVKYGGGSENLVDFLKKTSELGALIERAEKNVTALGSSTGTDDEANQEVAELGAWVSTSKLRLAKLLRSNIKDAHMWRSE
jgi:hypothetical protein